MIYNSLNTDTTSPSMPFTLKKRHAIEIPCSLVPPHSPPHLNPSQCASQSSRSDYSHPASPAARERAFETKHAHGLRTIGLSYTSR
ncbi:hypothetical protein HBI70_137200 [Parastagonospora nodorum]|nr:hypothetical protein HBH42_142660 [Parastagonospora nodorum]KAH5029806.1 hypothetical protein HBI75_124190 [Parastagonospora nodorum]KAH5266407.1 hypothetical protein HBI70_137200 [Parastagonospora nodorum]KAH5321507.1 hypothetical protein HBI12_103390 [Parastagonospora nodorum]KAH5412270.1 hypothetical protein HBI46_154370 [Parastagonospora nodorum]